jgi:hypothetical protein
MPRFFEVDEVEKHDTPHQQQFIWLTQYITESKVKFSARVGVR